MLKFRSPETGLSVAALLTFSAASALPDGKVQRPALLFRAGDYPDKGVSITEDDLAGMVERFNAGGSAPVKSEHLDSPLDPFGDVTALYQVGPELFGMLCFSSGIDAHLRERKVDGSGLSCGIAKLPDGGFELQEVSIVFKPHVEGAGFLSHPVVTQKIAQFSAQGKVTPAMVPMLEKLYGAPQLITFSDGSAVNVAAELDALLAALPVVQPRTGGVPANFSQAKNVISETNARVAKAFGLDPAAHQKSVDKMNAERLVTA